LTSNESIHTGASVVEPERESLPAQELSRGDLVATGDLARPGEVRHVEVGEAEVLVVFRGPWTRSYPVGELVALADPAAVEAAQREAARRQRRTDVLAGLHAFAALADESGAPLPASVEVSGSMGSRADVEAFAAAFGLEVREDTPAGSCSARWTYGAEQRWPAVEVRVWHFQRQADPVRSSAGVAR
jgi:hypothetical protein